MQIWRSSNTKDPRWYLGVPCRYCKSPILFGLDRSEGHAPASPSLKLVLTCPDPECGRQADYSSTSVSRYQKNNDVAKRTKVGR